VPQLFGDQLGQRSGGAAVAQGAQLQCMLKFIFAVHGWLQSTHSPQ